MRENWSFLLRTSNSFFWIVTKLGHICGEYTWYNQNKFQRNLYICMFGMNRTMSKMAEIGTFAFIKQTLFHGSSWNLVILYIYIFSFFMPYIKGISVSTIDLWPFNDLRLEYRDFPDLSFEQLETDLHETRSEYVSTDYLTNRQLSVESAWALTSYNNSIHSY